MVHSTRLHYYYSTLSSSCPHPNPQTADGHSVALAVLLVLSIMGPKIVSTKLIWALRTALASCSCLFRYAVPRLIDATGITGCSHPSTLCCMLALAVAFESFECALLACPRPCWELHAGRLHLWRISLITESTSKHPPAPSTTALPLHAGCSSVLNRTWSQQGLEVA